MFAIQFPFFSDTIVMTTTNMFRIENISGREVTSYHGMILGVKSNMIERFRVRCVACICSNYHAARILLLEIITISEELCELQGNKEK
jgi:hypothetical protein